MNGEGEKAPKIGRPRVKIDLLELEKLCNLQCTVDEIAAFFGVSSRTIDRRAQSGKFREIIEHGRAKGRISVRRNLFRQANAGNVAASIFLAKNILGYRDVVANEHSGPNGGPIPLEGRPDLSKLSREDLEKLREILEKTEPESGD